jgi:DNA-binding MarR family transcriptional regulator
MLRVPADKLPALKVRSKALLGRADRLLVAAAIARAGPNDIYEKRIAEVTKLDKSRVGEQLRHFERAGMLDRRELGADRYQRYDAADSTYWEMCWRLFREIVR